MTIKIKKIEDMAHKMRVEYFSHLCIFKTEYNKEKIEKSKKRLIEIRKFFRAIHPLCSEITKEQIDDLTDHKIDEKDNLFCDISTGNH